MEEPNVNAVACDICGGIFKSTAGLSSHKRATHATIISTPVVVEEPVVETPKVEIKQANNVESNKVAIFKSFLKVSLVDKVYRDVFDKLMAYPFVRTLLPRAANEPRNATELVGHNGLLMELPKGVYLDLPQPIVDSLNENMSVSTEYIKPYEISDQNNLGKQILKGI